jgi:hypothetical protein
MNNDRFSLLNQQQHNTIFILVQVYKDISIRYVTTDDVINFFLFPFYVFVFFFFFC